MKIYFVIFFVYNNEQILSQEYSYIGCYKNLNHYDLLQGSNYTNQHMMSARVCVDVCRKHNFQYAGTEFGYKCFCGNDINPRYNKFNNNIVNHDQCDIRCAGNGSEICGGNIRISVYRINKSFTTINRLPVTTTTQNTNVQQKPTHGFQNRYSHPPVVMSKTISPYFVSSGAPSKTVSTVTMGSITSNTAVKSTHFIPQNTHVGSSSVGDIHTSWFNISERGKYTPAKSVETTKHTLNENTTIFKSLNTTNSTRVTTDSIDTTSSAYTGISDAFNTSESAPKSNCECHCKQMSKWDSILNSLPLRFKGSGCHYNSIYYNTGTK